MRSAFTVTMLLAAVAMPQPVLAIVVPDTTPSTCSVQNSGAVVQMPCAKQTTQIQTLRYAMMKSLVPMHCRPVGVHYNIAGFSVDPGRGAGLVASALFSHDKHAQVEQVCDPTKL